MTPGQLASLTMALLGLTLWVLVGALSVKVHWRSRGLALGTAVALYGAALGGLITSVLAVTQPQLVQLSSIIWRTTVAVAGAYALIAIVRAAARARRKPPS